MFTLVHTPARYLALGPRFGVVLGPQRYLLRFPGFRDLVDFRGSGRAGDIQFLPSRGNYQDKIISSSLYIPTKGI